MNKPAEATASNRVLSDDEIRALWCGLPKALPRDEANAVATDGRIPPSPSSISARGQFNASGSSSFCLVTAQRVGEVAGMVHSEIDLAAREWRLLTGSRTKNGHPHIVPLSDLAIGIIKEAMAEAGETGAIFPSGAGSLLPLAVAQAIYRANKTSKTRERGRFGIAPWSVHDLRRTALTGMARLGVAPIVLGHVANHRTTTRAGVTLAVYSQYIYDKEKREALNLWADRLAAIVRGAGASNHPSPMRGQPRDEGFDRRQMEKHLFSLATQGAN